MNRENLKILILEDTPADVELVKAYLKKMERKIEFRAVDNREDFTYNLYNFLPDIILSDHNVPAFSGMDALEIVKQKQPDTPFIFVTGSLGEDKAVEAIKAGACDFVTKGKAKNLPFAILKALRESSERHAKIEAINQSHLIEQRFKALIENSTEGLSIFDEKGIISYTSPAIKKIMGYEPEEVIGKSGTDIFAHKEELEQIAAIFKKLFTGESKSETLVSRNRKKDGSYVWLEIVITDQRHVEGVNALVANYRDVTEKITAQRELEHTLQNLEEIIDKRTSDLQVTHTKLEEAYADIKDSLNYAKKIQNAVLPSETELKTNFKDVFLIYKPKDIVSGDFYWTYKHESISLIAVVDCTGHGVPGALMSMIGNEILDHIIKDRQIGRPDVVLEELDKSINRLLRRKGGEVKMNDGMDIALCAIDQTNKLISFSGAHNPAVLVSSTGKLKILEASKHSIGGLSAGFKDFKRVITPYEEEDILYLFSDGFHDQFGGPRNKKFMKKQFYVTLQEIAKLPFQRQKKALSFVFKTWKKSHAQLDDVTVLGIKL